MTPERIRRELFRIRKRVKQADIARTCGVSKTMVYSVIDGKAVSEPVMIEIARALGRPPHEVFPKRFKPPDCPDTGTIAQSD